MAKNGYTKCIEFMQMIKSKGLEHEISREQLYTWIYAYFGGDKRTFDKYLDLLWHKFEFIEKKNDYIFIVKEKYEKIF